MIQADLLSTPPPALSHKDAERIMRATFGLDGIASPLDSERDQNFPQQHDRMAAGPVPDAARFGGVRDHVERSAVVEAALSVDATWISGMP